MHHGPDTSSIRSSRTPPLTDFHEVEGPSNEAVLSVSEASPFTILHASQDWLDLFRFSKEEIVGRSIRVINGPHTDMPLLQSIIQQTPEEKQRSAVITLYTSSGHGNVLIVRAYRRHGACTLTMVLSDAVPSQQVTTQVDKARMLITSSEPYFVQQISAGFSRMFGLSDQEIVGRTIRMLDGPHTDILAFQQLIAKARTGFSQRGTIIAFTKDCVELTCEVQLVPIVGCNGLFSHLQIDFSAPINQAAAPHFLPQYEEWHSEEASSSHRALPLWPAASGSLPLQQFEPAAAALPPDRHSQLPPVHIGLPWPQAPATQRPNPQAPIDMPQPGHPAGAFAQAAYFPTMAAHVPPHAPAPAPAPPPHSLIPSSAAAYRPPVPHPPHHFAPSAPYHPFSADNRRMSTSPTAGPQPQPEAASTRAASATSEATRASSSRTVATSRASSSASEGAAGGERRGRGDRSSLRLFPRRKAGESDLRSLGGPVDLSKDIVDEFVGMSMKEASQKLGISASAMKKACRKLGIKKWPHKSTKASVDVMTYNSAYVRRLYSKYAEKDQHGAAGSKGDGHHQADAHGPGSPHAPSDISEGSEGNLSASPCAAPSGAALSFRHGGGATTPSVVWDHPWPHSPSASHGAPFAPQGSGGAPYGGPGPGHG